MSCAKYDKIDRRLFEFTSKVLIEKKLNRASCINQNSMTWRQKVAQNDLLILVIILRERP